jgi:prepilin-type N-terminal cleavage/methylation domain-containing protein/prepilin-type processing-associated H-X9-DG protein
MTHRSPRAFTLIELLVVISIIGLLLGLLLPVLSRAAAAARASTCFSNLHNIAIASATYTADNKQLIIPSYNMAGTGSGVDTPIDGWAAIMDRDGYSAGNRINRASAFACPDVVDVEGMASGQTGSNPDNAKGWMDWPNIRNGSGVGNVATTLPDRGFNLIIRASYWVNSDNPIGAASTIKPDTFFTCSVGYGPDTAGKYMKALRLDSKVIYPSQLIGFADGLYAGKQAQNRINVTDSRIGYRHPGKSVNAANVAFADGHAGSIGGDVFPRGGQAADNTDASLPTLYANPKTFFGVP